MLRVAAGLSCLHVFAAGLELTNFVAVMVATELERFADVLTHLGMVRWWLCVTVD